MPIIRILAGAALFAIALGAAPAANAQNDGDGATVTRPHKTIDPAAKAARIAKRKHRREMRRQARERRQQMQQGSPAAPAMPPSN